MCVFLCVLVLQLFYQVPSSDHCAFRIRALRHFVTVATTVMILSLGFESPILKRNRKSVHKCDSFTTGLNRPAIREQSLPAVQQKLQWRGGRVV
jgi:hypothetical protein